MRQVSDIDPGVGAAQAEQFVFQTGRTKALLFLQVARRLEPSVPPEG
jgi:hypothetical protein